MASRTPTQRNGVAQAFAQACEVPDAAVVTAIAVAGRTTHVGVSGQARIPGVVEQLLAVEHLGREFFCGHGSNRDQRCHGPLSVSHQRSQVVHANRSVHEIVDVQAQTIRRNCQSVRGPTGIESEDLGLADGINHGDLAAGLECDEEIRSRRMKCRRAAEA